MTVKTPMTTDDQQEAFDLLASLIEYQVNVDADAEAHPVWWHAIAFCNKLRDRDMITRERYLKDFARNNPFFSQESDDDKEAPAPQTQEEPANATAKLHRGRSGHVDSPDAVPGTVDDGEPLNPPFMSFSAFEQTGRFVNDLGDELRDETLAGRVGWLFLDSFYIELTPNAPSRPPITCYLQLGRCEWIGDYDELLSRLYLYVAGEYGWDEGP